MTLPVFVVSVREEITGHGPVFPVLYQRLDAKTFRDVQMRVATLYYYRLCPLAHRRVGTAYLYNFPVFIAHYNGMYYL